MDPKRFVRHTGSWPPNENGMETYKDFDATELYCPACRQAVPVRKRLLLVLPEGEKYEYLCAYCAGSVGTKIDRDINSLSIIS